MKINGELQRIVSIQPMTIHEAPGILQYLHAGLGRYALLRMQALGIVSKLECLLTRESNFLFPFVSVVCNCPSKDDVWFFLLADRFPEKMQGLVGSVVVSVEYVDKRVLNRFGSSC